MNQSRANDATIQANEKELMSLKAAIDKQKNEHAVANQRRTELENGVKRAENQLRMATKDIDSLCADREKCAIDQNKLQKLVSETSSLRKEIDFHAKMTRTPVPKLGQKVR